MAGVLAMEPETVMLDEPFGWLDYKQSQRLKVLLNTLNKQDKTLTVSAYDSNFSLKWGQQVLAMHSGELKVNCSVKELMMNTRIIDELYIVPPKIRLAKPIYK